MKACVDKRLKLFIEIWFSNSDWQNLTIALFLHSLTARSFFIENENSIRFFFLIMLLTICRYEQVKDCVK